MISKAYGFNFSNFFNFSNSFFRFSNFFSNSFSNFSNFFNFSNSFFRFSNSFSNSFSNFSNFHNSCQLPSLHSALLTEENGRLTKAMKRQNLSCQKCHFVRKKLPTLTNINKKGVFFIFPCHLLCAHTKGITFANVIRKT